MVAYVSDKKKTLNTNKSYYIVRKVGCKSGLGKVRVNLVQWVFSANKQRSLCGSVHNTTRMQPIE